MAYIAQEEKKARMPAIKAVLKKYGMRGTVGIRHHSTLVVKIKEGKLAFETGDFGHDVNVYHIDRHYEGEQKAFLTELLAAMKGNDWFDKSDSMTDYFHTAFYNDIKIGDWQKPYKVAA
jgi:hypothetical protein